MRHVIVSDIHLGSVASQVSKFLSFLDAKPFDRLIVNGDLIDYQKFNSFPDSHLDCFRRVRKLIDSGECVWLRGNHEGDIARLHIITGMMPVEQHRFESMGKRFLCLHGDIFDTLLIDHPVIDDLGSWFEHAVEVLDFGGRISRWIKRHSGRCAGGIQSGAHRLLATGEEDWIFCGHSHRPMTENGYTNSGSWLEPVCNYVVVEDGKVSLCDW